MTPLLAQRSRPDRAFERLYRRHVADVYHYAAAVLHNSTDAEDVTQTTFMNAYRAFSRGERPRSPHNWLIAIAHNVCRQRFRQSTRRPTEVALEDETLADGASDDAVASAGDVRRALGHLPFNQRAALVMRELEGRSYAEIADNLELSVPAVETLIFRARRSLREQLEGTLTCGEAERAISRQADGELPRSEKPALRAHLRECAECARFARSQRAQRAALKRLGALPLPGSLPSFFGGGAGGVAVTGSTAVGAGIGTGIVAKAAAVLAAGAAVAGVGYAAAEQAPWRAADRGAAADETSAARSTARRDARAARAAANPLAAVLTSVGKPDDSGAWKRSSPPSPAGSRKHVPKPALDVVAAPASSASSAEKRAPAATAYVLAGPLVAAADAAEPPRRRPPEKGPPPGQATAQAAPRGRATGRTDEPPPGRSRAPKPPGARANAPAGRDAEALGRQRERADKPKPADKPNAADKPKPQEHAPPARTNPAPPPRSAQAPPVSPASPPAPAQPVHPGPPPHAGPPAIAPGSGQDNGHGNAGAIGGGNVHGSGQGGGPPEAAQTASERPPKPKP